MFFCVCILFLRSIYMCKRRSTRSYNISTHFFNRIISRQISQKVDVLSIKHFLIYKHRIILSFAFGFRSICQKKTSSILKKEFVLNIFANKFIQTSSNFGVGTKDRCYKRPNHKRLMLQKIEYNKRPTHKRPKLQKIESNIRQNHKRSKVTKDRVLH